MVTVQPKHLALWAKAAPVTKPSTENKPPSYGAWHRQRAERRIEVEPEAEAPKELEGLAVTG